MNHYTRRRGARCHASRSHRRTSSMYFHARSTMTGTSRRTKGRTAVARKRRKIRHQFRRNGHQQGRSRRHRRRRSINRRSSPLTRRFHHGRPPRTKDRKGRPLIGRGRLPSGRHAHITDSPATRDTVTVRPAGRSRRTGAKGPIHNGPFSTCPERLTVIGNTLRATGHHGQVTVVSLGSTALGERELSIHH